MRPWEGQGCRDGAGPEWDRVRLSHPPTSTGDHTFWSGLRLFDQRQTGHTPFQDSLVGPQTSKQTMARGRVKGSSLEEGKPLLSPKQ